MTPHPYMRRLGRRRLDGSGAAFWAFGFLNELQGDRAAIGWETFDMGPASAESSSVARFWDKLALIRGYGVAAAVATASEKGADRATKPRKARRK